MKVKKILILVLMLSLISLILSSCWFDWLNSDSDGKLPSITQSGEDTFGCIVDGEIWLPKGQLIYTPRTQVSLERWSENRIWKIVANRKSSSAFLFSIPEERINEGVVNTTVDTSEDLRIYFSWEGNYPDEHFLWNEDLDGELIILRLDTINKIVAGTFWFDLKGDNGRLIEIRDGRFDLKIDTMDP